MQRRKRRFETLIVLLGGVALGIAFTNAFLLHRGNKQQSLVLPETTTPDVSAEPTVSAVSPNKRDVKDIKEYVKHQKLRLLPDSEVVLLNSDWDTTVEPLPSDWETRRFTDDILAVRPETTLIVIHHSETVGGSAKSIRRFHMSTEDPNYGYKDIGYHFVITNGNGGPDGQIQIGRREDLVGSHAGGTPGKRNFKSIGICFVGKNTFTKNQIDVGVLMVTGLCRKYGITPGETTIQPHRTEGQGNPCPGPGFDLENFIWRVKKEYGIN